MKKVLFTILLLILFLPEVKAQTSTLWKDSTLTYTGSIVRFPWAACKTITIYSSIYDTSTVYVGDSLSVAKNKYPIKFGQRQEFLVRNSNEIYFKASKSGTKINYYLEY